jgi:predicted Zn-dependent protease
MQLQVGPPPDAPLWPHFCGSFSDKFPHMDVIVTALTVLERTTSLRGGEVQSRADMTGSQTPTRMRRPGPATRVIAAVTAVAVGLAVLPVQAQDRGQKGPPVIRDAEIEQLLREYIAPLLKAAGLAKQNIQPVIINERSFNAFVADGRRIFINTGALMDSESPNQIIGVLAHETGHIAGGHLARMREQLAAASSQAIVAMLLGVGAMIAGARSSSGSNGGAGQAGMAAIMAPQAVMQNSMLAYLRTQEEQADRAGVKYLTATGQSARGMSDTFKRLADQTMFQSQYINPYFQSHPMPADRVRALEDLARSSPNWDHKDSAALQLRHDLMRAKLFGFVERPDTVARRYPPSDSSLPARYARAISAYRFGDPRGALGQIDALIQLQPQNPYFYELKGQALLEAGRAADAIAPLRQAVQLAPNGALIQVMLGQAMIESNDRGRSEEAISLLQTAALREPESPDAQAQLAMAYGRKGDIAHAELASAQAAFLRGDMKTAREFATRAKARFPVGSPGWVRADDIASYKPQARRN